MGGLEDTGVSDDVGDEASVGPTGTLRAAVIVNPSKSGLDRLRQAVARAEARQHFAPSLWLETTEDDPGKGMAVAAVGAGVDLIIAAGGDGTIRSAAAGVRGSGIPMGLVPLGTGNLFARNLGIPVNDLEDAVVLAFSGIERPIDAVVADIRRSNGTVESHVSLVMAGVGIDASMMATTNPDLKKRVGWLAYVDAGLRVLPAAKPFRAVYRIDDRRNHRPRASSILVANLGYLPGNIELIPDALPDDGKLDVVVLQPRNVFGWLAVWRRITWENVVMRRSPLGRQLLEMSRGNRRSDVVYGRGRRISIGIDGDPEEFQIDGDVFGTVIGADFHVDEHSLLIRVAE